MNLDRAECASRRRTGNILDGVWKSRKREREREREKYYCLWEWDVQRKWVPDGWTSVRECAWTVCGQPDTEIVQVAAISWAQVRSAMHLLRQMLVQTDDSLYFTIYNFAKKNTYIHQF